MNVTQINPKTKAIQCLTRALGSNDQDAWWAFRTSAAAFSEQQRAALAYMSLKTLGTDNAVLTCQAALDSFGAGPPIAPLFSHMDEAAFWTDMATPVEIEAYCLATFKAMPTPRQGAFLNHVQGRAAA